MAVSLKILINLVNADDQRFAFCIRWFGDDYLIDENKSCYLEMDQNEKKRAEWTLIGVLMKNDYCTGTKWTSYCDFLPTVFTIPGKQYFIVQIDTLIVGHVFIADNFYVIDEK